MCTVAAPYMMMASAGFQAVNASNSAKAQAKSLEYQAAVAANNQMVAGWQAADAIQQGQEEEQRLRLKYAQTKGTQRAALAANGVALDEGSAADILTSTDWAREVDANTVRANAARTAWGYRNQAQGYADSSNQLSAGASAINPLLAAGSSLLGNAGQVAGSWYRYSRTT